ncbi:enoyl-CoA hydratase-related protein [Myxococcus xanthus]|uniref:enoyl-CoA hydratase-related protein n=1 Tax=Myxococcus xanthus TaxID=34 RepID=UPI001F02E7F3|nr:enoyl-CoA hydratase-related protein [Myxococcus xanthus]
MIDVRLSCFDSRESCESVCLFGGLDLMTGTSMTRLEAGVLTLTFNRPQKKNAFNGELYEAAAQALLDADRNEAVRVVVLTGAGDNFTSGNDIKDFLQKPPNSEDNPFLRFMRAISRFEKPLVAGVDGVAVGVGTTMLLHCDHVVASARAMFSMPFVNLGLCPEGASSVLLPRLAGMSLASELLMFGDTFDAATALRARIVHQVVPEIELAEVVSQRASALAAKPVEALRLTKRLLREPLRAEVDAALQREGKHLFERIASAEAQAVFAAFLSGRK